MGEETPKLSEPEPPLDYQKPPRSTRGTVFFVLAILIAVASGGLSSLGVLFMIGDSTQWPLGATLLVGMILLIIGGILANKKLGMSATLAIVLVSICTFFLMLGVCSQFNIRIHYCPATTRTSPTGYDSWAILLAWVHAKRARLLRFFVKSSRLGFAESR